MPRKRKDFSFVRFFHTEKSLSTQLSRDGKSYVYFPKHYVPKGKLVWDSQRKGTYIRSIDGELKYSKRLVKTK